MSETGDQRPATVQMARCLWEVQAGIIPGTPMPEYTRRWGLTSDQWQAISDARALDEELSALTPYWRAVGEAAEYARHLMDPRRLNWVRLEWIWL